MTTAEPGGLLAGVEKRRPTDRLTLVGERLQAFRKALQLSQAEVAAAVNKAPNTVAMWESGQRLLDPLAAAALSDRYGGSLDWFYRGDLSGVRRELADRIAGTLAEPDRTARKARPFAASSSNSPAGEPLNKPPRRRRAGR